MDVCVWHQETLMWLWVGVSCLDASGIVEMVGTIRYNRIFAQTWRDYTETLRNLTLPCTHTHTPIEDGL